MSKPKQVKIDGMVFDFVWKNNTWYVRLVRTVKSALPTSVKIPDLVNGRVVRGIDTNAFKGRILETIEYPDSIEVIGNQAFYGCKFLKTVKSYSTTNTAKSISFGGQAFANCDNLTRFQTPVPVSYAAAGCFARCLQLKELKTTICNFGSCVFEGCSQLTLVTLADDVYWEQDSFVWAKNLKTFVFKGKVSNRVSATKIKALTKKKLICTNDFQYLDLSYEGTDIVMAQSI